MPIMIVDEAWTKLILEAIKAGMTKEEVRNFLSRMNN